MIIYEDGEMYNVPSKWLAEHDAKVRADDLIKAYEKLEKIEKAISDIEHIEGLMINMFVEWDCFKEHSYFEKLGISLCTEGMQTVGYILDCLKD